MSFTLFAVDTIILDSFCSPSRGPTSTILQLLLLEKHDRRNFKRVVEAIDIVVLEQRIIMIMMMIMMMSMSMSMLPFRSVVSCC
mmetsp:Transcript_10493/g.17374  ORF Transcript_10493/g.17374 Transcript_10493/m.17374 type:complete len:84 (-) Transcript_10493:42-293(-)